MRAFWHSLAFRITLAFVALSLLTLGAVGLFAVSYTNRQFDLLLRGHAQQDFTRSIQTYVQAHGSLAGFQPRGGGRDEPDSGPRFKDEPGRPPFVVLDAQRRVVLGDGRHPVASLVPGGGTPVSLQGRTVAYLLPSGRPANPDALSAAFLLRTGRAVLLAMLLAALVAVLLGVLISRTLLGPLRVLLGAIQAMQRGELGVQVPTHRQDELGAVMAAFDDMRAEVERNQQARRQLTADIAHDLNTPLAVIGGTLEGMLDGTFKVTPARLARLRQETEHITGLVKDLRFLSLADAGELPLNLEQLDLGPVVQDAVAGFQAVAQAQAVRLEYRLPDAAMSARMDALRVKQVLQNLLSNALRHTPSGGQVRVVGGTEPGGVTLAVEDTGEGIAPEQLPHVLERLYRADNARSGEGSGLGLAICRSIVEAHGGRITVSSTVGVGTRVQLYLPAAGPVTPAEAARPSGVRS